MSLTRNRNLAVIIAAVATLALSGCAAAEDPAPVQPAQAGKASTETKTQQKRSPIGLVAVKTKFTPSVLHAGGAFTSIRVTITNNTKQNLEVNPLFFAITDTGGTKHDSSTALGQDKRQIGTLTLAPGEKATGAVTAEGKFVPKTVSFARDGFGDTAKAVVG